MFIRLMCKLPNSPIKKETLINIEKIVYITPNGNDGEKTFIFLGDGEYLVADECFKMVQKLLEVTWNQSRKS